MGDFKAPPGYVPLTVHEILGPELSQGVRLKPERFSGSGSGGGRRSRGGGSSKGKQRRFRERRGGRGSNNSQARDLMAHGLPVDDDGDEE